MSDKENQSLDIFGIKPVGDAINTVTKGTVEGAQAFLGRICLPAAEEFGFLLSDIVGHWRQQNALRLAEKGQRKAKQIPDFDQKHAHPKIITRCLEEGSWVDDDEVQEMWAGLLITSCTENGKDESNLIFINLLSQLTTLQVRILNFACETAEKYIDKDMGFLLAKSLILSPDKLIEVTGMEDIQRLDRELDDLGHKGLIQGDIIGHGGFTTTSESVLAQENKDFTVIGFDNLNPTPNIDKNLTIVFLTPTALMLNLYARCNGADSAILFFDVPSSE